MLGSRERRRLYNRRKLRNNNLAVRRGAREIPPLTRPDLDAAGERLFPPGYYRGTFEEDDLPPASSLPRGEWGMVVNTLSKDDPLTKTGHWVAMAQTPDGARHFFDSYGRVPVRERWLRYLAGGRGRPPPTFVPTPVQALSTNSCGYFCLEFLKVRRSLSPRQRVTASMLPTEGRVASRSERVLRDPRPLRT